MLVGGHAGALLGFRFAVFPDRSPSLDAASLGRQARGRCARRASNVRSRQWVPVLWARDAGAGVPRRRPHAGAGHRRLRCGRRGRSPGRRSAREARAGTAGASQDPVARVAVFIDLAAAAVAGGLLAVMLFFRGPTVGRGIRPMRRLHSWPRASGGRAGVAGASGERRVLMTLAVRSVCSCLSAEGWTLVFPRDGTSFRVADDLGNG